MLKMCFMLNRMMHIMKIRMILKLNPILYTVLLMLYLCRMMHIMMIRMILKLNPLLYTVLLMLYLCRMMSIMMIRMMIKMNPHLYPRMKIMNQRKRRMKVKYLSLKSYFLNVLAR